jgi:hypothetical protein
MGTIMSKQTGIFTMGDGDSYTAPELLEPAARKAIKAQLDEFAFAAFTADQEIVRREMPVLRRGDVQQLVVAGAEARIRWIQRALAVSRAKGAPDAAEIEELARLRQTYEEFAAAFEGIRRLVERGYTHIG